MGSGFLEAPHHVWLDRHDRTHHHLHCGADRAGPRKLPELGRSLGKSLQEFKRASNELKHTLDEEISLEELKGGAVTDGGRGSHRPSY